MQLFSTHCCEIFRNKRMPLQFIDTLTLFNLPSAEQCVLKKENMVSQKQAITKLHTSAIVLLVSLWDVWQLAELLSFQQCGFFWENITDIIP